MPASTMPTSDATTGASYTFRLLRAGTFKLDGGSMFGLIPRVVWSRQVPTDDRGRITVQHNCLLLDRVGAPPAGVPRRILIEVGTGDKLDAKMREVFDLENRSIHTALAEVNVAAESIDAVIVSHLHFDHAGALTRLCREGESPDWQGDDGGGGSAARGGCKRSFTNAAIFVQQREWRDALANRSVMTKTYYPDHLLPIESQLRLIDSPRPFLPGYTPDRDELPPVPQHLRESELWPGGGISVFNVPGHTWGQQAVKFREADSPRGKGRTIAFTPDVMPTAAHLGAAYSLAYDVEPYTSMISRRWLLTEAAAQGWVLCLDHEPGHPLFRVKANAKGWFDLVPEAL
jgi:glyoxylase-like metal-dependent hydrolase (beta-lactamase superfamily II)